MFVDASALVAIIAREPDWEGHHKKIEQSPNVSVSPLALWEAAAALTRHRSGDLDGAMALIEGYILTSDIRIVPITAETGALAIDAFRRFGRGRHRAGLNFGDCFAYACARQQGVPLLFKGDDFPQTDIDAA